MPSNDTENIYATQYGGEGEPIPATKISYDNTDSGLSATKVQGAIDEIDSALDDAIVDITGLKTAVYDKYVIKSLNNSVSVKGDGVKTLSALLIEVASSLLEVVAALGDNEIVIPTVLFVQNVAWMDVIGEGGYYANNAEAITSAFSKIEYASSVEKLFFFKLDSTTPVAKRRELGETPSVDITDLESTTPANNANIVIYYKVLEKLEAEE